MKTVTHWLLEGRGIESEPYWQGVGVAFTDWKDCYTGIGDTAHDAAEDALEQAATSGWDTENTVDNLGRLAGPIPNNFGNAAQDLGDEEHVYVVLFVK